MRMIAGLVLLAVLVCCSGANCVGTCESNCEATCSWQEMMTDYYMPCDEACRAESIARCTQECVAENCG